MEAVFTREIPLSKTAARFIGIIALTLMMSLGAFVRISLPFSPVPITLQTFFVLLCAASLGTWGVVTQMLYIALGASGLPLFTGAGAGLLYVFGPTAGYLAGFVLAALFMSFALRSKRENPLYSLFIFFSASLMILFCGTVWLKVFLSCSWAQAFFAGFLVFIPGDLLKAAVACGIYSRLKSRFRQIF